ncbi:MAG: putative CocE/NonD family hydrolase [Flavobacteriaceae bacterium]|jgi:putative CocE/NonD family hydrolase
MKIALLLNQIDLGLAPNRTNINQRMRIPFILLAFLGLTTSLFSQGLTTNDYEKEELYIEMRDGVKLFTTIYTPKESQVDYPVLMIRTCYSVAPYGKDTMPAQIMHNPDLVASGYIFVKQDVRGRWMSEGVFENTKPPYSWTDKKRTDEVTDSYDTYDWLAKNLKNFNGNIGQYGNSYLGFTSLVASVTDHPNLKAVLAMAPVTNFYFEDFNRYGLYGMNYMPVMDVFGVQKTDTTSKSWYNVVDKPFMLDAENGLSEDYYDYFLQHRALSDVAHMIDSNNFFWNNIIAHPTYDAYRKQRNWIQYLNKSKCQTLVVGGWNDEQNLYGILNCFKKMAADAPESKAQLVLGPWSHGHPKRRDTAYYLGDIFYGDDLSKNYQEQVEFKYFEFHLKEKGAALDFRARVFDTGSKEWVNYQDDPFDDELKELTLYLNPNGSLSEQSTTESSTYVSDPDHPVPFLKEEEFHILAPKHYMTDDQRFVSRRPDVLSFVSDPLTDAITIQGEIEALIQFVTDHEDADLYVKVIDVFPMDRQPLITDKPGVKMNGFQHLVRCGYIRGRFHESFETATRLVPGEKTAIQVPLLEVLHTFKPGHRIMIQIQSSMFPLFDLNPQKYIENIYDAKDSDFESAVHEVFGDSKILLPIAKD